MKSTTTFLTFVGVQCRKAQDAINFYISLFPNSEIVSIDKYEEGEAGGTPNLIKHGVFKINGMEYMVSESNFDHAFTFSPAISIFVEYDTEEEMCDFFEKLSEGGQVMVPIDDYGYSYSKQYGWCADKYGVSWQFNLAK